MDEKKLLTSEETAKLLNITERHARRLRSDKGGPLVCIKQGKRLMFEADSVQAYLQAQNKKAGTEIQEQVQEIPAEKSLKIDTDTQSGYDAVADNDSQPDVNPSQSKEADDFSPHWPAPKEETFSFFKLLLEYVALQTEQKQLQNTIDELQNRFRKSIFRARRDRRLLHLVLALSLLNLLMLLTVLFSIAG